MSCRNRKVFKDLNIVWAGRYQFPIREEDYNQTLQRDPRRILIPTDLDLVERLFTHAAELAGYSEQHGWPS